MTLLPLMLMVGATYWITFTVAVLVQPLPVTATVYAPAMVADCVDDVPNGVTPRVQAYVKGPAGLMLALAVSIVEDDGQKPKVPVMFTDGISLMVSVTVEVDATQGAPAGLLEVSVNVTNPAEISAALGVYVALSVVLLGANVPPPPLHVPAVALPPTTPFKV